MPPWLWILLAVWLGGSVLIALAWSAFFRPITKWEDARAKQSRT